MGVNVKEVVDAVDAVRRCAYVWNIIPEQTRKKLTRERAFSARGVRLCEKANASTASREVEELEALWRLSGGAR